jgi:hypothetical protein
MGIEELFGGIMGRRLYMSEDRNPFRAWISKEEVARLSTMGALIP